jgi:hypothetical protein
MSEITNKITRSVSRAGLKIAKQSPHLMFGAGLVAVVGGAVLAARATLKAEPIVDQLNHDLEQIQEMRATSVKLDTRYATTEYKRDVMVMLGRHGKDLGKTYGPALLVGGSGIALLIASHTTLARRNKALALTLTAVSQAYAGYRNRVREHVGRDKELELFTNARPVEVETEDGRIELQMESSPNDFSIYAVCFDEQSRLWSKGHGVNYMSVVGVQRYMNQRLASHGHVFLNEVYDALGLPRTTPGSVVGWLWNSDGDNYIDFGINTPMNMAFVDGYERSCWLDFNVDGEIYQSIS